MITSIFTIVNIIALLCIGIGWFKGKYTIADLETWNTIVHFYNEHNKEKEELAGGYGGFFKDYLYNKEDEEYEEEEDE